MAMKIVLVLGCHYVIDTFKRVDRCQVLMTALVRFDFRHVCIMQSNCDYLLAALC
jgi:hypothetical protein